VGYFTAIFWNRPEGRFRALWRLLGQILLFVIVVAPFVPLFRYFKWSFVAGEGIQTLGMTVSVFVAARFLDRRTIRTLGLALDGRWWFDFVFGLLLGAAAMTLVFGIERGAGWVTVRDTFWTDTAGASFGRGLVMMVFLFACAGFIEELFSRGYLLRNLAEGFCGRAIQPGGAIVAAWFLSSTVFALLHLGNDNASAISLVGIFLAGLLLALPFVLTGQLAIGIGLHMTWNFFEGCVYGFPVSGEDLTARFLDTHVTGPETWTGGAFGPEGGWVGLIAMLFCLVVILLWVRLFYGELKLQTALAVYPVSGKDVNDQSDLNDGDRINGGDNAGENAVPSTGSPHSPTSPTDS